MKKVLTGFCMMIALIGGSVSAQQPALTSAPVAGQVTKDAPAEKASWPVWVQFNSADDIDIVGMRFTLPYGSCEAVTGFDIGLFGRCRYMNGLQINVLRNDVIDAAAGFQIGVYNSIGRADMLALQIGLWNEAHSFQGVQAGLINVCDSGVGFQLGIINRADAFYGFQIGIINVIRGGEVPFMPIMNIGF